MAAVSNRAYLATVLRTSAQILPDGWTSDTPRTLSAIAFGRYAKFQIFITAIISN